MQVLFDCVLIEEEVVEELTTTTGIVLPDTDPSSTLTKGVVVSVGDGKLTPDGTQITPTVKVGDNVLYNEKTIIDRHSIDSVDHVILREGSIVAVID